MSVVSWEPKPTVTNNTQVDIFYTIFGKLSNFLLQKLALFAVRRSAGYRITYNLPKDQNNYHE